MEPLSLVSLVASLVLAAVRAPVKSPSTNRMRALGFYIGNHSRGLRLFKYLEPPDTRDIGARRTDETG